MKIIDELKCLSLPTWIVIALFILIAIDMIGYYIAVLTDNQVRPFYIMEQIAPFLKGAVGGQ